MPQMACLFFIFHFRIRKSRFANRAPVDDALTAIDEPLFIEANKHFTNRLIAPCIHGETLTAPVTACAQSALLTVDTSAVFFFPLPSTLKESITTEIFLADAFLLHLLHNFDFGGNRCVISAW